MKKNKIAGLILASALLVGASGSATHANKQVNTNTNDKNIKDVSLLAGPSQGIANIAMVVNGNGNLVLRAQGNENAKIVTNISVGEMLKIESYNTNWYKVTVKETGATGYISASNLRFIESGLGDSNSSMNNYGQVINVSSALNLRSNASISSNVINTLTEGTNVKILAKQGEWYKVKANGTTGYVYGGYIKVGSEIQASENATSNTATSNATVNNTTATTKTQVSTPVVKKETTKTKTKTETAKPETTKTETAKPETTKTTTTKTEVSSKKAKTEVTNSDANKQAPVAQSFAAIMPVTNNTNSNSTQNAQVSQTGSVTLTFMNDSSQQLLSNQDVAINGTSYTTNAQGRVTLTGLNVGQTTFDVTMNNYNMTSATVNVKSGKRMTGIIYVTPATSNSNADSSSAANTSNNNTQTTNNNNNNNTTNNSQATNNNSNSSNSNGSANNNTNSTVNNNTSNNNSNTAANNNTSNNTANNNNSNSNSANSSQGSQTVTNSTNVSQLQQQIVNYAEQFLGRPYVWGATGPNAFDCSGLTYYVYKHFGYYIGCTTYTQVDKGTPVSVNDLEPGDLIFWGQASAPYHVAIYIGNGEYIQAPRPGENVDISSWNLDNISAAVRIV